MGCVSERDHTRTGQVHQLDWESDAAGLLESCIIIFNKIDACDFCIQVTGGQLHFNEGSNQPSKKDHLHLIVGQAFSVSITAGVITQAYNYSSIISFSNLNYLNPHHPNPQKLVIFHEFHYKMVAIL